MSAYSDSRRGKQREVVLKAPRAVRLTPFEPPTFACINEPEASGRILLLDVTDETERFEEVVAETDIGQPGVFEIDAQSEVIKFLAGSSLLIGDACGGRRSWQDDSSQQIWRSAEPSAMASLP